MGLTICWTDQLMSEANIELGDIHWLMDILQNIDVGLVVLDRNYDIQLWNGFMESHSGLSPQVARGENLFTLFPEIPKDTKKQKKNKRSIGKNKGIRSKNKKIKVEFLIPNCS